jgi:hypothetical protein
MVPHWSLLSMEDQHEYLALRATFQEAVGKSRRGESAGGFVARLRSVRSYIERDSSSQWKRSLVCGIVFVDPGIAINIGQFKLLVGRCKSSINGSLQQIGYVSKPPGDDVERELRRAILNMRDDSIELRKWTIRSWRSESPAREDPPIVEQREVVRCGFPCPAKCRHKLDDIVQMSLPPQTEVGPL